MSVGSVIEPGGRLHLALAHSNGRIAQVDITSSRPVDAARVLIGRTPREAVRLVPLLFSLCSGAQRIAALIACERAQDLEPTLAEQAARDFSLQLETIREHALRILLDWPVALGIEPDRDTAAQLLAQQRLIANSLTHDRSATHDSTRQLTALIREAVLGEGWEEVTGTGTFGLRPHTMLQRLLHTLFTNDWQTLGAGCSTRHLESFSDRAWQARLTHAASGYAQRPEIDGQARETTPYARQSDTPLIKAAFRRWGDGLATRLLALAGELNSTLPKLQDYLEQAGSATPGEPLDDDAAAGDGIGVVEAARGKLMHRITLSQGRIQDYDIVAPTEWNFHPRGIAVQALAQLTFRSEASCAAQARALICAIDPCVAYDLDIRRHA
ncbi:MAG: nickel-dependent hydrogenase large subunit [Acidihalobacter sp.]|uniref:nickel-dependent hydrogenase large subunit n=1 Tax=Acidihalobacter sp. TaxID=1872108 RepID=UPI00307E958C